MRCPVCQSVFESEALLEQHKNPPLTSAEQKRYRNSDSWTARRWAWEALKRNKEFIADCAAIRVDDLDDDERVSRQKAVASKYHLVKFKSSKSFPVPLPRFKSASPSFWLGEVDPASGKVRKGNRVTVTLEPGQVLYRFDLRSTLKSKGSLPKLLKAAEERLRTIRLEMLSGTKEPSGILDPKLFLERLRLWDAKKHRDGGETNIDIYRRLYPCTYALYGGAPNEVRDALRNKEKGAAEMMEKYLEIAVLD